MAAPPPDPFAPPDLHPSSSPLELEAAAPKPRAPGTLAPQGAAPPAPPAAPARNAAPEPRKPIAYKNPDPGAPAYILWVVAAIGLGAAIVGAAKFLGGTVASSPANQHLAANTPAPAAPVQWKSIAQGDEVLVTVEVAPRSARGARLLLDGAPLPSNPVRLPRGSQHKISALAEGYEPATVEVTPAAPATVRLELRRR